MDDGGGVNTSEERQKLSSREREREKETLRFVFKVEKGQRDK